MIQIVGTQSFKTKVALQKYTQELIDSLQPFKKIYPTHKSVFNFLKALFERHPSCKEHEEIKSFTVQHNRGLVYNNDKSFSWKKCITQKEDSNMSKFNTALRLLIKPQTSARKSNVCTLCCNDGKTDVDHVIPFKDLVERFLEEYENIDVNGVVYNTGASSWRDKGFDTTDEYTKSLADFFYEFHEDEAELQNLCKKCHLKKSADDRKKLSKEDDSDDDIPHQFFNGN